MDKLWEPTFDDWLEDKVSLFSCELDTSCMSHNKYGVVMQLDTEDDNYPEDSAIFWTDEQHLYLRYNWETWYKVSNENPDNCANICKRNSAILLICSALSLEHRAVKVYHIDELPEALFGRPPDE